MRMFRFKPVDTWFFKEARPMDGFGGMELASVFPPPPRTLLGALRTAVGDAHNVDWSSYPQAYPQLAETLGDAYGYGKLHAKGVFLWRKGEVLYPLPLHIVHMEKKRFAKMPIGEPVECDLGKMRLPSLPTQDGNRYEIFDNAAWVSAKNIARVLEGDTPQEVFTLDTFIHEESRVGIGRDLQTKTVQEGMLYMTKHLRIERDIEIALMLECPDDLIDRAIVRFGGEGRAAVIEATNAETLPTAMDPKGEVEGIFFSLLTPAIVDPVKPMGEQVTSACLGKSVREGGFDMARRRSREARSYLPAGSTWFVAMDADGAKEFISQHHDTQIGEEQELGRGRIVCGYWTK